jgi:hypothetical protein
MKRWKYIALLALGVLLACLIGESDFLWLILAGVAFGVDWHGDEKGKEE